MIVLIDADGVLEDLSQKWVTYLNEKYGTSVRYEDLTEWDMTAAFPSLTRDQVYEIDRDEEFYSRLEPIPGAVEAVGRLLEDGHELYVVTTTPYQVVKPKMERAIFRFFPCFTWKNIIITANKHLIRGDVLIDDGVHNLVGGDYRKILVTAPYNRNFDAEANGMIRVGSWDEIYRAVSAMAADEKES